MKKTGGRRHLKRNIVLWSLLALLCIGAVELAACSIYAPDVYERITAPVRYAATATVDACRAGLSRAGKFCLDVGEGISQFAARTADQAAQFWTDLTTPAETPEPEPVEGTEPAENTEATAIPNPSATNPPYTEVLEEDGQTILTGGSTRITYFCQSDEQWAGLPYGTDTIGPYGCGPTAMAMVVASMTDNYMDPAAMAAWAVEHGYWAPRSGSRHSIIMGTAQAFGLEAESFTSRDVRDLQAALRDRKILVALMGNGHFTSGGHFIILRGVTLSGEILVADPNSLENSLQAWDPQLLLDELSSAQDSGAPLWVISRPSSY